MKPYALKNFDKQFIKHVNIQDVGSYVWTPYLNIKSEYKNDFEIYDDEEYANVSVPYIEIDEVLDDPLNFEWCIGSDFCEWEYEDFISNLIKPNNHYLVCNRKYNWCRDTRYTFVDTLADAFMKDYDCMQYYDGGSSGGKSIQILEYSHDVPMGHSIMIIGLTDKEYDRLTLCENFETIIKFINRISKSIIEI